MWLSWIGASPVLSTRKAPWQLLPSVCHLSSKTSKAQSINWLACPSYWTPTAVGIMRCPFFFSLAWLRLQSLQAFRQHLVLRVSDCPRCRSGETESIAQANAQALLLARLLAAVSATIAMVSAMAWVFWAAGGPGSLLHTWKQNRKELQNPWAIGPAFPWLALLPLLAFCLGASARICQLFTSSTDIINNSTHDILMQRWWPAASRSPSRASNIGKRHQHQDV